MPPLRLRNTGLVLSLTLAAASACSQDPEPKSDMEDGGADAGERQDDAEAPKPDSGSVVPECTVTPPTSCPEPAPRYSDVEPIIGARCLSCHDGKGANWPLTTYRHVADWSLEIRNMVSSCEMPPADADIPMTDAERETILAWLKCGFPQ